MSARARPAIEPQATTSYLVAPRMKIIRVQPPSGIGGDVDSDCLVPVCGNLKRDSFCRVTLTVYGAPI